MKRRAFIRLGAAGLTMAGASAWPTWVLATSDRSKKGDGALVVVFQRGAADGLHMVVPYRDRRYRELRGALALDGPGRGEHPTLDLGDGFAFHPALSPLYPLYQSGRLAVVVNVGSHEPTRSHFDAQDYMESGTPGRKSTRDGWLARAAGALTGAESPTPFTAVSLSTRMPRSLSGGPDAIALDDFRKLSLPGGDSSLVDRLEELYASESNAELSRAGTEAFRAARMFRDAGAVRSRSSRSSRGGDPSRQLSELLGLDLGIRIAFVESGGWDTHFAQGGATGQLANLLANLAGSVRRLLDESEGGAPLTVMTVTEFGRTAAANGAAGTDHGHGTMMMVAGAGVRGGRVVGDWLGLDQRNLYEGRDLPVTTDFRDLFDEVARAVLGLDEKPTLFPGHRPARVGVMG